MRFRIILMFAVLVISFSLLSCIRLREINVEISCDQFNENHHAKSEFQATVGDRIAVKLCSNPTTGFQWKYETIGEIVLQETEHKFVPPEGEGVVGAAGKEVWTFKAVEKGTTQLRMEYSRPWEGGEQEEWTYTTTVTVE